MAENGFQRKPLRYADDALARGFRHREAVHVSPNVFLHYEEGAPGAVVAPDVFTVFGAPAHDRRSYRRWEEPEGPGFVLESASHGRRRVEQEAKRRICAELGVAEYRQIDPTGDHLVPPVRGGRLAAGRCVRLPLRPSPGGALFGRGEAPGLDLGLAEGRLRFRDPTTGHDLTSSEELEERLEQAARAREAAEARLAELDARRLGTPRPPSPAPAGAT